MVLEVMGRDAGHIALSAGISGGADAILIPEIGWDIKSLANKIIDVKEMHVKLKNPISKISSFLSKYVIFRSKDKTTIHLRYKKNIISSGEIIKKLIENKCDIKELSTKETDLEEIFLRLLKN